MTKRDKLLFSTLVSNVKKMIPEEAFTKKGRKTYVDLSSLPLLEKATKAKPAKEKKPTRAKPQRKKNTSRGEIGFTIIRNPQRTHNRLPSDDNQEQMFKSEEYVKDSLFTKGHTVEQIVLNSKEALGFYLEPSAVNEIISNLKSMLDAVILLPNDVMNAKLLNKMEAELPNVTIPNDKPNRNIVVSLKLAPMPVSLFYAQLKKLIDLNTRVTFFLADRFIKNKPNVSTEELKALEQIVALAFKSRDILTRIGKKNKLFKAKEEAFKNAVNRITLYCQTLGVPYDVQYIQYTHSLVTTDIFEYALNQLLQENNMKDLMYTINESYEDFQVARVDKENTYYLNCLEYDFPTKSTISNSDLAVTWAEEAKSNIAKSYDSTKRINDIESEDEDSIEDTQLLDNNTDDDNNND